MKFFLIILPYLCVFEVECMFLKSINHGIRFDDQVKIHNKSNFALLNYSDLEHKDLAKDTDDLQKKEPKYSEDRIINREDTSFEDSSSYETHKISNITQLIQNDLKYKDLADKDVFLLKNELNNSEERIIGGEDLKLEESSSYVTILKGKQFLCSGTLISDITVLTSANCVSDEYFNSKGLIEYRPYFAEELKIRMSSSSIFTGGSIHYAKSIHIHPMYMKKKLITLYRDLALITLLQQVKFGPNIYFASIQPTLGDNINGTECTVIGWQGDRTKDKKHHLKQINVTLVHPYLCKDYFISSDPSVHICAANKNASVCQNDYGSGLFCDGKVVAVASWNEGCVFGKPTLYARVDNIQAFANKAIISSISLLHFTLFNLLPFFVLCILRFNF